MRHTTWLQNRTPAHALNGRTPYKMKNNKKLHLAGIQEFGVAAYVKDLKAGKLDACAQVGQFVGYDSESGSIGLIKNQSQLNRMLSLTRMMYSLLMMLPLFLVIPMLRGGGTGLFSLPKIMRHMTKMSVNPSKEPMNLSHYLIVSHKILYHSHQNQKLAMILYLNHWKTEISHQNVDEVSEHESRRVPTNKYMKVDLL